MNQKDLIEKRDWDNLIILDACRYDYFESSYREYLKGSLLKALSPASCTREWFMRCWSKVYDITYFSSIPMTASYWIARHFSKVIKLWLHGWDKTLGTVPPWAVNNAVIKELKNNPSSSFLIHYIQPHWPYIANGTPLIGKNLRGKKRRTLKSKNITETDDIQELREGYSKNLHIVLKYVKQLLPHLHGNTVITADHGEMLGEKDKFGHNCQWNDPILRTVPWFRCEKQ